MSFAPAANYPVTSGPRSIATGDFNADSIPDLAVANQHTNSIGVLLGNAAPGRGTFQAAVNHPVGLEPIFLRVAQLNGDAQPDIVVACFVSHAASVLMGAGNAAFAPVVHYPVGSTASSVAIGDFNADGVPDMAVATWNSPNVYLLTGVPGGTFQTAVPYAVASGSNAVVACDVDSDGRSDVAVANYLEATPSVVGSVSVLKANPDGTALPALNYNVGINPAHLAVSDFNADDRPDLVVANINDASVSVLIGKADGTFESSVQYPVGGGPGFVAAGDLSGDARPDLVVVNTRTNNVSVLTGNANGTFQAAVNFPVGTSPSSVALGDFNGDGKVDLAVSNWVDNTVSVLMNTSAPSFTQQPGQTLTCPDGGGSFTASANASAPTYRWQRETVPNSGVFVDLANGSSASWDGGLGAAVVLGANSPNLIIAANVSGNQLLTQVHAIRYRCTVSTSACGGGNATSMPAKLIVCPADFDCSGGVAIDDLFSYFNAWFSQHPRANFDGLNGTSIDDLFMFINAWFVGCDT